MSHGLFDHLDASDLRSVYQQLKGKILTEIEAVTSEEQLDLDVNIRVGRIIGATSTHFVIENYEQENAFQLLHNLVTVPELLDILDALLVLDDSDDGKPEGN